MSGAEFTPDSPCVVGLQWFPSGLPKMYVADDIADQSTLEVVVESTATETVSDVAYFVDAGAGTPLDLQALAGLFSVEVYDADNLGSESSTITQYVPTDDVGSFNLQRWNGSGFDTSNFKIAVDTLPAGFTPGTYLGYGTANDTWIAPRTGSGSLYEFQCGGIAGSLTGEQVIAVRVVAIIDQLTQGTSAASATFIPYIVTAGLRTSGSASTISGGQPNGRRIEATFYANPRTGCPWTIADAEDFATSGNSAGGLEVLANGDPNRLPVCYSLSIEIMHRAEPRLAYGCLSTPDAGWNSIAMTAPDGTPGWAKVSGTRYLVALRKRGGPPATRLVVPYIFTTDKLGILPPVTYGVFTDYAIKTRQPTSWSHDVHDDATPGIVMVVGAGVSADSQPYATFGGAPEPAIGEPGFRGFVDSTHVLRQQITAPATAAFGSVRLLACVTTLVNAPLKVTLKTTAGATLAGPITFTLDDLVAPLDGLQVLHDLFATAAALINGTQYWLEITSACTNGFWLVQCLTTFDESATGGPPAGSENQTAGGSANGLIIDGETYSWLDACITLHQNPAQLVGMTATGNAGATPHCSVQPSIAVGWTAWTPNCGTFDRYELQRSIDAGANWQTIAKITTLATHVVHDYECPVNVACTYRVRVVRTDGAASAWSEWATGVTSSDCCGFWFSSNVAPSSSVWYDDIGPTRPLQALENATTVQLEDRDFQVGFRELEERGDSFDLTVLVASNAAVDGTPVAATPGRRTFDPLLVLGGNKRDSAGDKVTVPYVCVRTKDGDVWYATLRFTRPAVRTEPFGDYQQEVTVVEVTDVAYPFDA